MFEEAGATMGPMTTDQSDSGTPGATSIAAQSAVPTGAHDADFTFRWAYGNPEAPFTIVEFGDFECPYCGAAKPVLHELINGSDGQVRLVWRHFPLFEPHPYALTAALAAEAAGHQGAFWPMAGLLFKNQDSLDDASIVRYGEQLGLDTSTLVGEPAQRFADAVRTDYQDGIDAGVHGTPTLFINGEPYTNGVSVTDLRDTMGLSRKRTSRFRR
jgi:protein-disulfide isomerase